MGKALPPHSTRCSEAGIHHLHPPRTAWATGALAPLLFLATILWCTIRGATCSLTGTAGRCAPARHLHVLKCLALPEEKLFEFRLPFTWLDLRATFSQG